MSGREAGAFRSAAQICVDSRRRWSADADRPAHQVRHLMALGRAEIAGGEQAPTPSAWRRSRTCTDAIVGFLMVIRSGAPRLRAPQPQIAPPRREGLGGAR